MPVIWEVAVCFLLICHGGVQASSRQVQSEQPYRTAYHFLPAKNWMNDPNGPMYYKGVYHLFYQHNPYGPVFGIIFWGHSISYDLVSWVHIDNAIDPIHPYEINGCWSGSATILPGEIPAILYTGIESDYRQVQNLALPKNLSDPLLREWVKSPHNPIMVPTGDIDPKNFRDPTTAWQGPDKIWRLIIADQVDGHGRAILFQSEDFVNWYRSGNPLYSSEKTGMWECPDFFPVSTNSNIGVETSSQAKFTKHVLKESFYPHDYYVDFVNWYRSGNPLHSENTDMWESSDSCPDSTKSNNGVETSSQAQFTKYVLKASFNHHDYYILGNYTPETDEFKPETDFMDVGKDFRIDYGKFYASKTFFDPAKKRRILWGWVNESASEAHDIEKGWSGLQAFPRTILLSESGQQLVQWPIEEIETLRSKSLSFYNEDLKAGSILEVSGITASQADIEVSFDLPNLEEAELMNSDWNDPQLLCDVKKASDRGKIGPFGLLVLATEDLKEQTAVFFRILRSNDRYVVLMCSDQSRSSLHEELDKTTYGAFMDLDPRHEKVTLRSLIDHSIVESFGGEGRTCISARVYPKLAINDQARLYAFNNGTMDVKISRLSAWSMKAAQFVSANKEESHESS